MNSNTITEQSNRGGKPMEEIKEHHILIDEVEEPEMIEETKGQ